MLVRVVSTFVDRARGVRVHPGVELELSEKNAMELIEKQCAIKLPQATGAPGPVFTPEQAAEKRGRKRQQKWASN